MKVIANNLKPYWHIVISKTTWNAHSWESSRLAGIVNKSDLYMDIGSLVFSPSLNASSLTTGPIRQSKLLNKSTKSFFIKFLLSVL